MRIRSNFIPVGRTNESLGKDYGETSVNPEMTVQNSFELNEVILK